MKKIMALVLTTALALTLFVGCGKSNTTTTQTDNSLERVQKAGELTIGLDDSYPPMEYRDESNNLVGFDIDLGAEIANKLGVKAKSVPTDWNGVVLALKSSKFDVVLSAMSITPERQKEIDFAGPYIDGGQIIVVKNGSAIKTSADLKDKVLGCQLGATGEQAAMKIQGTKEVKKYDKITEAFHDLSIGRLDAVIVDAQVGGFYTKKEMGVYKILDERLTKEPEGIGVRKEDQKLKAAIQKALDDLKADGTLTKLSNKWFGYDIYK